jgi:hypothetical protein
MSSGGSVEALLSYLPKKQQSAMLKAVVTVKIRPQLYGLGLAAEAPVAEEPDGENLISSADSTSPLGVA